MGDHRISWAIKAEFHGVKRENGTPEQMTWLNFYSSECDGVDDRVIEFFRELYAAGMAVYDKQIAEHRRRENAVETERHERAVLAKLKAKYEPAPPPPQEEK